MIPRILTAAIFSEFPEVRFGFSTRIDGALPNPLRDEGAFLESLGIRPDAVAIPKQVHGNVVVKVSGPGVYEECDALVADRRDVFLRVTVADCLPVFIFDPSSHSVAAVHAGWRGCLNRLAHCAVVRMIDEFGARPSSMRAYIGPSARPCCYEIGEELAGRFEDRFLIRRPGTRPHLAMQACTSALLQDLGLHPSHIEVSPHCTVCNPQLFHSYRRDGGKSGRMTGVIGLRTY